MYWYKQPHIRSFFILNMTIIISGLYSCKPDVKVSKANFFDVKKYFTAEADRLGKLSPVISKSATHNGTTQTKTVNIKNWPAELDLFINSDINKPAWRDSYSEVKTGDFIIYKAKTDELKTREILIKQVNKKVVYIAIYNRSKNMLYNNSEKLSYFPDSLYQIVKRQQVRVVGTNNYKIEGFFKR